MAEKSPPKKRPPRQQMLEALSETEKSVAERREAGLRPEEKAEAKAVAGAVAIAEDLSARGVIESIGELRGSISKTLGTISDRLEELVQRYVQLQRAIAAKDQELKEIYEIQRSASTLTALFEAHESKNVAMESELAADRQELQREIDHTRVQWEQESRQRDAEIKERDAAETKRREREKEEYRYAFTREQQQARNAFADETAKSQKQLAETKAAADKDHAQREQALAVREQELISLRAKVEAFPKDLDAAVAKAVKDVTARLTQESTGREELLKTGKFRREERADHAHLVPGTHRSGAIAAAHVAFGTNRKGVCPGAGNRGAGGRRQRRSQTACGIAADARGSAAERRRRTLRPGGLPPHFGVEPFSTGRRSLHRSYCLVTESSRACQKSPPQKGRSLSGPSYQLKITLRGSKPPICAPHPGSGRLQPRNPAGRHSGSHGLA